jgi:hypothetical protein
MNKLFVLLLMLLSFVNAACAAELFATVESLSGRASVSDDSLQPKTVSVGQQIYAGQTLTTAPDGEVHLETADGGLIAIRPNTVFRVDEYKADGGSDDRIFMSLLKGAMRSITGWIGKYNASGYRITTPHATLGIRGTDHETTVIDEANGDEPGTYDMVSEGRTVLKTRYGEVEVTPEKFAFAPKLRAVAPVFLVKKPDFWVKRKLVIEDLIPKRKELLRERIEKLRDDRIRQLKEVRSERTGKAGEKAKEVREKRQKTLSDRKRQAEKRREVMRKEKKWNAAQGGKQKAERIKRKQPQHKPGNKGRSPQKE